jgi:hypothetical protein
LHPDHRRTRRRSDRSQSPSILRSTAACCSPGRKPRYLSARITGRHGCSSQIAETPAWSPPTKIVARYLAPYLDQSNTASRADICHERVAER